MLAVRRFALLSPSQIIALYSWCIWQQDNIAVGGEVTPIIYTSLQVPYLMHFVEFIVQGAETKIKLQLVHRATVFIMARDIKGVFVPQSNYPVVLYVFSVLAGLS